MIDKPMRRSHPIRLLLVEDEPAVRRSLQLLLTGQGFQVRAFASGLDLLADPVSLSATLLIADFNMPQVDGMMVLRELKALGWTGAAMMITGFGSAELEARAISAGYDMVLQKPLLDRAFIEAVERLAGAAPQGT